MVTKEHIHRLVDTLPEDELESVVRFLEQLRLDSDPFFQSLTDAPEEDEPETPEETAAIDDGLAALARGEVRSLKEVKAKYRVSSS